MAVTLQSGFPVTNNTGATEVTSRTFSVTVNSGTNRAMSVAVGAEGNGSGGVSVSSVTFNGTNLTRIDEASNATWSFAEIWGTTDHEPAVTTANVVVTMDTADKWITGVMCCDGVDQTTRFRTAAKSTGSSTSASDTVSGWTSGDYLIDSLSIDSTGHSATVGANQTQDWNLETAAGQNTGCGSHQTTTDGVMSWTWTTSGPYSHVATAFIAAGAATPVIPFLVTAPYKPVYR